MKRMSDWSAPKVAYSPWGEYVDAPLENLLFEVLLYREAMVYSC